MKAGDLDAALAEIKKARDVAAGNERVKSASADLATKLAQRADARTSEGKLDDAVVDLRKARELDPGNAQARSGAVRLSQFFADRADRLLVGQKLSEAEGQVKYALELDPENVTAKRVGKRVAQAYAIRAANFLDEGKEPDARASIDGALNLDRQNELANTLHRSMVADPLKELGAKYFEYKIEPGDTLSWIAGECLGDQYLFYLLSRYNGIAVPRSVKVGQTIKVPGTKKCPSKRAAPRPRPDEPSSDRDMSKKGPGVDPDVSSKAASLYDECKREWKSGDKDRALELCRDAGRLNPKEEKIHQDTERIRQELMQVCDRRAREAYRRQDLDGCIAQWDKCLQLQPGNESARVERDRCVRLKQQIDSVGAR